MNPRRVTINDVATRAGVSKTAVSFAFNDPSKLSEGTLQQILSAADQLGYVRDPAARMLRTRRTNSLGVLLPPDAEWDDIVPDLPRFPVVAVAIPKLFDGRAFSIARLLRERDGYKGEIRAVGIFTVDQMPAMRRVGIDAFQVEDELTGRQLERGVWPEVKEYYQPTEAGPQVPAGTRPWTRRSVT